MTITLGLTGSIGMGKSTAAKMFAQKGCGVWDADAAVTELYAKGGAAVSPMSDYVPEATLNGFVDKTILKDLLQRSPEKLSIIETIVHPLVGEHRNNFKNTTKADILIFDIPLLFETGADQECDATACVYVDEKTQGERVMQRPGMTEAQFEALNSKQMPNDEKLKKVDYKIPTYDFLSAEKAVEFIIEDLQKRLEHA